MCLASAAWVLAVHLQKGNLVSIGKDYLSGGNKADNFGYGIFHGRAFSILEHFLWCFPSELCHQKFRFLQQSSSGIKCNLPIQLQLQDLQMLCKLNALIGRKVRQLLSLSLTWACRLFLRDFVCDGGEFSGLVWSSVLCRGTFTLCVEDYL